MIITFCQHPDLGGFYSHTFIEVSFIFEMLFITICYIIITMLLCNNNI
jgi:hypothetical protein